MSISNPAIRKAKPAPDLSAKCWCIPQRKRIPQHLVCQNERHSASVQVEIEKELRRQLLEVDEHSSHQGRQLERLQQHTVAMHALAPGMPSPLPALYSSFYIASHSPCDFLCILPALLPCRLLWRQSCYHYHLACTAVTVQPVTPCTFLCATST